MRHLAVLASLVFLAACPSSEEEPPAPPAPETPLSEVSGEDMRAMCNELVVADGDQLVVASDVADCVTRSAECDQAEVDQCASRLPQTFPNREASCALGDETVAELQACSDVTFAELRECLASRVQINLKAATDLTCTTLDQFRDDYNATCLEQSQRCPAIDFAFLRVQ